MRVEIRQAAKVVVCLARRLPRQSKARFFFLCKLYKHKHKAKITGRVLSSSRRPCSRKKKKDIEKPVWSGTKSSLCPNALRRVEIGRKSETRDCRERGAMQATFNKVHKKRERKNRREGYATSARYKSPRRDRIPRFEIGSLRSVCKRSAQLARSCLLRQLLTRCAQQVAASFDCA